MTEHLRTALAEADRLAAKLAEAEGLLRRLSSATPRMRETRARAIAAGHALIDEGGALRLPPTTQETP
jgi:hypothetical protein